MPFHYSLASSLASGTVFFAVQPATFPRVALEADVWAEFRVRKLAFRLLPTSPSTVAQAAGYIGGIQDTAPSTYAQVVELLPSCLKGVGQTIPSSWVHVSKSELAGVFPWYKSIAGSQDPSEESPGSVIVVGTGTEAYNIEFKGVFEFKVAVNSANTPLALKLREAVRKEKLDLVMAAERKILLKILQGSDPQKITP